MHKLFSQHFNRHVYSLTIVLSSALPAIWRYIILKMFHHLHLCTVNKYNQNLQLKTQIVQFNLIISIFFLKKNALNKRKHFSSVHEIVENLKSVVNEITQRIGW